MGSERDRPLAILAGVTMIALAVWSLLRERRTVPAARVTIADDGRVTAALRLRELDDMQLYDSALL